MVSGGGAGIEVYVDGEGPAFVILPSYGRDGGKDYDDITGRLADAGWKVLRPQPRGVARSTGTMSGLTLHDLADDVARCIRYLADGTAILLGHAFGNILARVVTTDHPGLVKAAILAAAQASKVPEDVAKTPFVAGDPSLPERDRLAALRQAFFAPGHDAGIWLDGWYPATLAMQRDAVKASGLAKSWACGGVPLLQLIAEHDPFIPKEYWGELHGQLGDRVMTVIIEGASHALFPEKPDSIADAVLPWAALHR